MKKIVSILLLTCFVTAWATAQVPMIYDYQCSGYDPVTNRYWSAFWNDTGGGKCGITTDAKFCYWDPWDCSTTEDWGGYANPQNLGCCEDEPLA